MNWIHQKCREIKLRRRTNQILRATGIRLTEAEKRAVSSDQYIYWELESWTSQSRRALCACLWALIHDPITFQHYRPTNAWAARLTIPDPALRECPKEKAMDVAEADYRLLYMLYNRCRAHGVKTCTVHECYRGPAPQPERIIKSHEMHKTIPYHPAHP